LLQDVTAGFAAAARHAGAPITVEAEPLPVHLDRLATEQIVDNLVSNALKHGGRTLVEVTGRASGDRVCIQVRDHGPGMPANDRTRMLAPFERVVGQGERRGGFGVGLWVVGQFAAAMQGNVVIGDAPGGGAVVTVTLPRQLASNIQDAQP
jgi:two-component system OmpR family sensor kinase